MRQSTSDHFFVKKVVLLELNKGPQHTVANVDNLTRKGVDMATFSLLEHRVPARQEFKQQARLLRLHKSAGANVKLSSG